MTFRESDGWTTDWAVRHQAKMAKAREAAEYKPLIPGEQTPFDGIKAGRYFFDLTPIAKPRQTQSDKWRQRPAVMAYRRFADELRAQAAAQAFVLPDAFWSVQFLLPMPQSWSKRKRAEHLGAAHRQKPDIDNLLKAVLDSLRPQDDSGVWDLRGLTKVWADHGAIIITVEGT